MDNPPPKLKQGQVSLIRADLNTGHVLKTNDELYLGQGDTFEIFDSVELAESFVKERLTEKVDIEYVIYNSNADPILYLSKNEKRTLKK